MLSLEIKIVAQVQTNLLLDVGNLTYKNFSILAYSAQLNLNVYFCKTEKCIFDISSRWVDVSYGWFRNISIAWRTSVSSLFLDHLKSPHSRMMDEVIKLERGQNESRGIYFWESCLLSVTHRQFK